MADTETLAPVDQETQGQPNQPAQPVPAQEDLADLVPVEESAKPLAGAHPAAATADLVPVEGTEKKLLLPKPPASIQASGVVGPTSMSAAPGGVAEFMRRVQADVKNGSDTTWVGSMLKYLGAKGTDYGVNPEIGDFM